MYANHGGGSPVQRQREAAGVPEMTDYLDTVDCVVSTEQL